MCNIDRKIYFDSMIKYCFVNAKKGPVNVCVSVQVRWVLKNLFWFC